jgi:hypothetical protein
MKYELRTNGRADYSKASKDRTMLLRATPFGDIYINPNPLRQGTSKLHNIYTFDLLPGVTCPDNEACINGCYALNGQRTRPDVYNMRAIHTYMAKYQPNLLIAMLNDSIKELPKGSIVRPHASGDFFDGKYAKMWYQLMTVYLDTMFYTYTKSKNVHIAKMNYLSNVNIIPSTEPFDGRNFAPLAQVLAFLGSKEGKGWIVCPATLASGLKCGLDCSYCLKKGNKNVVFVQHR